MAFIDTLLALSPTAVYRLGEAAGTVADDAVGALNGTYTGSPTLNQGSSLTGDANGSVAFSGSSQYVDLGDQFDQPGTQAFSLLIHALPTTIDAGFRRLWGKGFYTSDADRGGIHITVNTGGLSVTRQSVVGGVGSSNTLTYATGLTLNAWNYIVWTYDGTNQRIYLNGALVAGPTASAVSLPNFTQIAGIAGTPTSQPYFIGRLDEVAIWSGTALSAANVTSLYNAAVAPSDIQTIAGPFTILNSPAAPSDLTAVAASASQIDLAWQDNAGDESGFVVQRKTGSGGTWADLAGMPLAAGTTTYGNTGLSEGVEYHYRVRATNATGDSGYSNEAADQTLLAAPSGLNLTVISASRIDLAWTDNSAAETGYEVERKTDVTGFVNVSGTLAAGSTAYQSTGLTAGTVYTYRVRAVNAVTQSAYSNEASAQTQAAPADTAMTRPLQVEVAFATDPGDAPVWTDITIYVQQVSWRRGRSTERDLVEAGTCAVLLDNRDRRFDPSYTAGPYYPNVRPLRRLRIRALHLDVAYVVWSGYVDGWPQSYATGDATVEVTATDAFKALAALTVAAQTFAEATTGARIAAVLDAAGWPAADRNLAVGQTTMPALTMDAATDALSLLREAERAEGTGLLFVSKDGKVTFQDRHARVTQPYLTSLATLGESTGTGEKLYADVRFRYDDAFVWNEVTVEREGGVARTAEDATSQGRYFRRSLELTGIQMTDDAEAEDAAEWLLGRYAEPQLRAEPVAIDPDNNDPAVMYAHLYGREISDRITLVKRPQGVGSAISVPSHLEAIEVSRDFRTSGFTAAWTLSPADAPSYWILQDATYGALDSTARLGW